MSTGRYIGRVGALAVSLGVGFAAVTVQGVAVAEPSDSPSSDSTALLVCGAACPTWHDADVDVIMNQFITPTHPDEVITPVAVTTPSEYWPLTGLLRLVAVAVGSPLAGPGGAAWPDEPWWKLSGLFDLTAGQSLQAGVADLEQAMAANDNNHLVIYGYSLGAGIVNVEKRRLAEEYPAGTTAPDIDFVLGGDPNLPNGGLSARFPGLYVPILDIPFNGPAATDTQFKTVEINRQYDGAADFPLYPLNVVADLNAGLGFLYLHTYPFDVSLAPDASTSPAFQGTHGDTSYYFFESPDLPLFAPLRQLGVPESLIDVVEPFFRVLVDLGYDRSIPPWEPTPARLIPQFDLAKVIADLVNAIGEGINNALALVGVPPLSSVPAPSTLAAPATQTAKADISPHVMSSSTSTQTQQVTVDGNDDQNPAGDVERHGDQTQQVTSTDPPTRTQQVSSAPADDSEPSTAATSEPSTSTSTPKPAKPRPVVRDSLGAVQQLPDRPHRGKGDHTTGETVALDDAATSESPSDAAQSGDSSPKGGSSSGNDASDST